MPASSSNNKRRILNDSLQPKINTFFKSTSSTSTGASLALPPLPPSVQSDLMNVGMRVRKAVSEGYKTKDCYYSKIVNQSNSHFYGTWTNTLSGYKAEKENNLNSENGQAYEGNTSLSGSKSSACKRAHEGQNEGVEIGLELRKATPSPPINSASNHSQPTVQRAFALPKSQVAKNARKRAFHVAVSRKEVIDGINISVSADEFEEAMFLRPAGDVMDVE